MGGGACTSARITGTKIRPSRPNQVPAPCHCTKKSFGKVVEYVHSLPRGPIFPQYRTNKYNRRNDHASKVNSEFVRNLGITDRRKAPMHSWRHFAKTYFKNDPRVKEEIHDAITGHGSDREGQRYGVYESRAMAKAIARLPNPLQGRPPATG
jgi:integrase